MTKDQKDNLFSLVKSLTKSEKRQFKLYVGRLGVNTDSKFLNLCMANRRQALVYRAKFFGQLFFN